MYRDLIQQAETLALLDARKPRQVNLRRAVSSAYYALFHFLVHEACCAQLGTRHVDAPFRHALGRAFSHSTMKQACLSFGGGTLKKVIAQGLPTGPDGMYHAPQPIQDIARTFAELQVKRHFADYDLSVRYIRSDVLGLVEQTNTQIATFAEYPQSSDRRFFLACLWAWKDLASR